jgi:hypothetical protein
MEGVASEETKRSTVVKSTCEREGRCLSVLCHERAEPDAMQISRTEDKFGGEG